jgi:hypothetical protein
MTEETRQKWISLTMDLMVAYYYAQMAIWKAQFPKATHPDGIVRTVCDRVADAIGDGATGEFVLEMLEKRIQRQ